MNNFVLSSTIHKYLFSNAMLIATIMWVGPIWTLDHMRVIRKTWALNAYGHGAQAIVRIIGQVTRNDQMKKNEEVHKQTQKCHDRIGRTIWRCNVTQLPRHA